MKAIKTTIALILLIPIKSGSSQTINSDFTNAQKVQRLNKEIDSISTQVNLNLDLMEYQARIGKL